MYVCGPTVYNFVHMATPAPTWCSVCSPRCCAVVRWTALRRNITDVDDKINNAARELGVPIATITDRFAAAFRDDMAALGVVALMSSRRRPATSPRS